MTNNVPSPGGILLATINAKWIHPSLALRLLKANLGPLEQNCAIMEFALRQPLHEKLDPILASQPRILGLSVSIWNHTATLELLKNLHKAWRAESRLTETRPIVVLGGPEVSYLPEDSEIFRYADYCIKGEGEVAFRELCETIVNNNIKIAKIIHKIIFVNNFQQVNITEIKNAYHLYSDEDIRQKLIYVEASRGCPFGCEFCLSVHSPQVREFPLEPFLAEMDNLIQRGVRTFKFLDRTFNLNIERAQRIMEFFLAKIEERVIMYVSGQAVLSSPFVVHFEMVPSRFPWELMFSLIRFHSGTLRLEIGIQTLNPEVSARIGRPSDPEQELKDIRHLREATEAIIHADLIAGLPGEDMASFGRGFDRLWDALGTSRTAGSAEIQLGILKLLPGTPIARHTAAFGMRYSPLPPYEVIETGAISPQNLARIKNFARFWELIVNRGLITIDSNPIFAHFMDLSDFLLANFGKNWGIDKNELQKTAQEWLIKNPARC